MQWLAQCASISQVSGSNPTRGKRCRGRGREREKERREEGKGEREGSTEAKEGREGRRGDRSRKKIHHVTCFFSCRRRGRKAVRDYQELTRIVSTTMAASLKMTHFL